MKGVDAAVQHYCSLPVQSLAVEWNDRNWNFKIFHTRLIQLCLCQGLQRGRKCMAQPINRSPVLSISPYQNVVDLERLLHVEMCFVT